EEAEPAKAGVDWIAEVQLLAFTGANPAEVMRQVESCPADPAWPDLCRRADESRCAWRPDAGCRLLLVIERGRTDLAKLLARALELVKAHGEERFARSAEAFWGRGAEAGRLGVLFPGQGAQYVGMLRDLACHFPEAHAVVAQADRAAVEAI